MDMHGTEPAILVTGGAGYIGSHTCRALRGAGFLPVSLDDLTYGHREFVKWGPLICGDIRDSRLISNVISDFKIQAVIHFAAYAYVGESVVDPARYYDNNVVGTLGLLNGIRQSACQTVVLSSTCAVYGQPVTVPIGESCPTVPINPYGRSKLMCEHILADYCFAYDFRSIVLRYFNASGAAPGSGIGELREVETHLIPRAMMALQGYVEDFEVFGSDFATGDGTAIRDYIHVMDLADAHVLALKKLLAGAGGGTFNLGVGTGHSVADVLKCITDVVGQNLPTPRGSRRPGDPACLVADSSLARDEMGFVPTKSDLRNIIETAWEWHLHAHPKRFQESATKPSSA